jgi:type I restriction enzyme S subunit
MEDLGIDRKLLKPTQLKPLASVVGSYTYFADGDVLLAKINPCFENGKLGIAKGLVHDLRLCESPSALQRSGVGRRTGAAGAGDLREMRPAAVRL